MEQHILDWVATYGNVALFSLLVLGIVGAPVPDETLLLFAGVLIGRGTINGPGTYLAAIAGAVSGATISFLIGRVAGVTVLRRYGHFVHINPENLDQAHHVFRGPGRWALMFGYFVPGVRHVTALTAGAAGLEFGVFSTFAYTGAALWAAAFVSLGWYLGDRWRELERAVVFNGRLVTILIAAGLAGAWFFRKWWRRSL